MERGVACTEHTIAYFSMDVGISEEITTYSGGLGVLAGDTLKSMADLGINAVAVTLLSAKGYFQQTFDDHNYQHEEYKEWDYKNILTKHDTQVTVNLYDREVIVGVWSYRIQGHGGDDGVVYFLDTDIEGNSEEDRKLTSYLYGGDHYYRMHQEIILGIGGVKILNKLGIIPQKYHMNEGHAAFLTLELLDELGPGDDTLKQNCVKQLCSFTTHTPVAAGHDKFALADAKKALGHYLNDYILSKVVRDGKLNMTLLAIEYSSYVNAVARKHGEVSRHMFPEYKIDYITNGVHHLTWVNHHIASLFDTYVPDWKTNPMELRNAHAIPLMELLSAHQKAKQKLIDAVNERYGVDFDADTFTLVFARRAARYKRIWLLFKDLERLKHISNHAGKLQIIFAGKAHPKDKQMKETLQWVIGLRKELAPAVKFVFMENYSMETGKLLTAGCDLWLNNPQRPLEASGTSGMKAALNGIPSLSVPDGWWIEGLIEGKTGWSIGEELLDEQNEDRINEMDANQIYEKLEHKILPLYYSNKKEWSRIMRYCIAINASYFNTHRMVKQYFMRAYLRRC